MCTTRQENPHCELVSFDRDYANAFQLCVNDTLAFAVKRDEFMYEIVLKVRKVKVDFIYKPHQQGSKDNLVFFRDPKEEKFVEAIMDVHFEAFQISDVCVRLFKDGWFETEIKEDDDPKLSIGYDSSSSLDQNQQWVVVAW
ncbi:NPL4-like protein 2 [Glycine soja]|uniref:NPL4-like protein 2 n=1 Tax=Glycine soja TaxID=3848 RepID=A0A0B2QKE3_GLYSO|nr:NPL4-like protein 2 [Glycine soja]